MAKSIHRHLLFVLATILIIAQSSATAQCLYGSYERSLSELLDSTKVWDWNTNTLAFEDLIRLTTFTYDEYGKMTTQLQQTVSNNVRANSERMFYTYDDSNNVKKILFQKWNNAAWENDAIDTFTYDSKNRNISLITTQFSGNNTGIILYLYTYDSVDRITNYTSKEWDTVGWMNIDTDSWSYNGHNNVVYHDYMIWDEVNACWFSWFVSGTSYSDTFIYTYDVSHNPVQELQKRVENRIWQNYKLFTYVFDENNDSTSRLIQNWTYDTGWTWQNYQRDYYAYDSNYNQIWDSTEYWTNYNNQWFWVSDGVSYSAYDAAKNLTWAKYLQDIPIYQNVDSIHYYYGGPTAIKYIPTMDASIMIYPNPTNSALTVNFNNVPMPITATLFDIAGNRVMSHLITQKLSQINLSDLSHGIYQMVIIDGNGNKIAKSVIKQ